MKKHLESGKRKWRKDVQNAARAQRMPSCYPFEPTTALLPETKQQDQPDGITTELAVHATPVH